MCLRISFQPLAQFPALQFSQQSTTFDLTLNLNIRPKWRQQNLAQPIPASRDPSVVVHPRQTLPSLMVLALYERFARLPLNQ
jgi:hypothetical protein